MTEDNTYENTKIDEALTAMVDAFCKVTSDLNTLQHGMIAHLSLPTKHQLLGRIVQALHIVDSDSLGDSLAQYCVGVLFDSDSFVAIRDSIEMEYDRRIRDGEMSESFYESIKECLDVPDMDGPMVMSSVGNGNIQVSGLRNVVKINNDSVDMGDDEFYQSIKTSSDDTQSPITLRLDHSIENRPKDMHPFKHEYFQAELTKHGGLRIWYGKIGLTLEVIKTGEKAQLTWSDAE